MKNCKKRWVGHNKRGAGLTEYVVILHVAAFVVVGAAGLFGDNIRALFASADNSLVGEDSTPATRLYAPEGPSQDQLRAMRAGLDAALFDTKKMGLHGALNLDLASRSAHPLDIRGEAKQLYKGYEVRKTNAAAVIIAGMIIGSIIFIALTGPNISPPTAGWYPRY